MSRTTKSKTYRKDKQESNTTKINQKVVKRKYNRQKEKRTWED